VILNPKDNYVTIQVDNNRQILGQFRGHSAPPHSQALEISEWTQIIATFGYFQSMQGTYNRIGSSIVVNGKEENNVLALSDPNLAQLSQSGAEITIGAIDPKSFEGSIGFIEIYSAGAPIQTSKYHLVIYV